MFRTRVITAIIGIAIILYCLYQGGILWKGLFMVLAIVALYEYLDMMRRKNYPVLWVPDYALLLLLWASPLLQTWWVGAGLLTIIVVVAALGVFSYPRLSVAGLSLNLFGPLYLGLTLQYALRVQALDNAFMVMLLALLLTWASDIGGYAVGIVWGKRKMAPLLSPKKTWEGALGSLLFCLLTIGVYMYFSELTTHQRAYLVLLAALASIAAQLGDLFMSAIKRYFEVKDSGSIIPGHGGVLDRFDSLLLVLPLVYYAMALIS